MPQKRSARKRLRQSRERRLRNRQRKGQVKKAVQQFEQSLRAGETDQAAERLRLCYKKLDQVAAKGTLHKNTAARKKARLARRLWKATS